LDNEKDCKQQQNQKLGRGKDLAGLRNLVFLPQRKMGAYLFGHRPVIGFCITGVSASG